MGNQGTVTLKELKADRVTAPRVLPSPLSDASLSAIATAQLDRQIIVAPDAIVFALSARHPYDPAGLMDFYQPGRWDSTIDTVYMEHIVSGPSPGEWDGTVGYVQYKAQAGASYLVAVHFSGYQTTMSARGPWGTASAYTATTSDSGAVTALWEGTAGTTLYFSISCSNVNNLSGLGYLTSIQVHRL